MILKGIIFIWMHFCIAKNWSVVEIWQCLRNTMFSNCNYECNKILKLVNRHGWCTVQEYLDDTLAFGGSYKFMFSRHTRLRRRAHTKKTLENIVRNHFYWNNENRDKPFEFHYIWSHIILFQYTFLIESIAFIWTNIKAPNQVWWLYA